MTKKILNSLGPSMEEAENECSASILSYSDAAETIRSHFSGTVFSHTLLRKTIGEEYGLSRNPIEMCGEARLVAGLFSMDCYYGVLPGEDPRMSAFVWDSWYGTPDKEYFCTLNPLESRTICMISAAAERNDESSIADIMIAAICHEILYNIHHEGFCRWKESGTAVKRCAHLIRSAEKILTAKKYRLWNRGRYYVYDLDDDDIDRLVMELGAEVPDGAMIGEAIFDSYGHFFKDCRFEIINSKMLERSLFCYEQSVYQYIRENGIEGHRADVEKFRTAARKINNIPPVRNQNMPAVVDKRIDEFIERRR